ncbi:MAG TPA: TIGR00375 family protein [Methanococcaceae archaeon]|uniref:TIGR00375 family protein n=1 Tax=Methanothermococcus okinawensis TaxID=155863 RepID=A0A832ZGV6_9EURY|nr:TIGR00375 family protein [Methanococcaceae archaeon]HIP90975.1 TIGR00375 family protein [Methanothermococcus okinawensis]
MIVNCDLHIHSRFAGGSSKYMDIEHILRYGKLKGLHIVGTGDCLHPTYLQEIQEYKNSSLILTVEIEDRNRVHHLVLLPSISKAYELRERLKKYSNNIDTEGRPKVSLGGEELLEIVRETGGLIGPAHAFTPYTSLYKSFNSIYDCYGKKPDFLELGLSADTDMGDMVEELRDIPFLSNSDAHSYHPYRLGREFNQFEVRGIGGLEENFQEIRRSIKHRKIVANYGLAPALGKYHLTACSKCYLRYRIEDAIKLNYRCATCGGVIKKGVYDRTLELSRDKKVVHLDFRPPYYKIIPLSQIISLSIGRGIGSKVVENLWRKYIELFNNEIEVLVKEDIANLIKVNERVGRTIEMFRKNRIYYYPGGGGEYGRILKTPPKIRWYKPMTTLDTWLK